MKELKINVVRFENEDVIATSGICAYKDASGYLAGTLAGHIYYDGTNYKGYEFVNGAFVYQGNVNPEAANGVGVNTSGWYHRVDDST